MFAAEGLVDRLCPLLADERLGEACGLLMMRVGVMTGHTALFLDTPFISLVGVASCRSDGGFGLDRKSVV